MLGAMIIYVGINVGLGGILTLGFQVPNDFATVSDSVAFAIQDSHVRFLGGMFCGVGLTFVAGVVVPHRLWKALTVLCAIGFFAGWFRLWADLDVLANSALTLSMAIEVVGFPVLGVALWRRFGRTAIFA